VIVVLVISFLGLTATPARADALGQLCSMAGETNCPSFPTHSPTPQYREPREHSCPSCEAEAQAELSRNLATMSHPSLALAMSANLSEILAEDVAADNAVMIAADGALGVALGPELLTGALLAGTGLLVYNAVMNVRDAGPTVPLPVWLNMLSFSHANAQGQTKTCEQLEADLKTNCPDTGSTPCEPGDTCEQLLAKRKPLVGCAHTWKALADQKCGAASTRSAEKKANERSVARCGDLISQNDACCPAELKALKKIVCPYNLPGCAEEGRMADSSLTATICVGAKTKLIGAAACQQARIRERKECFGDLDEPNHGKALDDVGRLMEKCNDVIGRATRLNLCP
jgi:hypothetical protein